MRAKSITMNGGSSHRHRWRCHRIQPRRVYGDRQYYRKQRRHIDRHRRIIWFYECRRSGGEPHGGQRGTVVGVGVAVSNTLAVNSGTLTATSGTANMNIAVMAAANLTTGDGVIIKCNSGGNTGYADEANFTTTNDLDMGLVFEGTDQTTIATDVKIYKLPAYPVTINAKKDGVSWSSHGKTFKLSKDGGSTFITDITKVADGTYTVYEGSTNTTVQVTVNGAAVSATVNYWGVRFFDGCSPTSIPPQTQPKPAIPLPDGKLQTAQPHLILQTKPSVGEQRYMQAGRQRPTLSP